MTITRAQLKLAAKAAGIECAAFPGSTSLWVNFGEGIVEFRPDFDHGQLLDLAMACEINIQPLYKSIEYEAGNLIYVKEVDCQDFTRLAEAVITAAAEQQQAKETKP